MTKPQLTRRQSYWLDHYHRCKEQNLSFENYCRQNNLSPGAFAHARGKLTKIGAINQNSSDQLQKAAGFVAVKSAQIPIHTQSAQIILPGQIKIDVPLPLVTSLLSSLLQGGVHDPT